MTGGGLTAQTARQRLYDIIRSEDPFEEKARAALDVGVAYLDADNGHLTRIDTETDHWETVVSTDPPDGQFPPGLELDLTTTYCRRTLAADAPVALHDAPAQGWDADPAFEAHGLHCYHGTTLVVDGEPYGTVCFVATDRREEPFTDGETMFAELVTRLLERELERNHHEAELTRRANLVNVLNRVLRHNLRNDMCVIRGRLQHLLDGIDDDTQGRAALDKIDGLIELSEKARRLELTIGQNEQYRATDMVALLERVADTVSEEFPAASISIRSAEACTAAVRPTFERALEELVENAAKHSGETPSVSVTVEYVPNAVEISIVDDGPGLSQQERQVLDTGVETPLIHGTGIGLWLAYWIVTSHDGTIETHVTDDGTEMTVSVPRSAKAQTRDVVKLEQARDRYQAAFEEANDAMIVVDDDARIVEANPEVRSLYQQDRQDLLGRSIQEFLPEEFEFEAIWNRFQTAGTIRDRIPFLGSDGTERTVEFSGRTDIIPGQHLLIIRDVTERTVRERERERAETIFQRAQDALFLVDVTEDTEFRVQRVNTVYEDLTGLSNADIRGKTPQEVVGDEIGADIHARYSECVEREETIEYQEEIPVDGEIRYWDTKLSPVVVDGTVVSLVGAMRDVTERVRREEELRTKTRAMDMAPVGITIADATREDMPLVYVNDSFCDLTGYEETEVLGRNCRFLQGEETSAQQVTKLDRALDGGHPVNVVLQNYRKDGTAFWNRLRLAPVENADGEIVNYVGFQEDVTERKERERALRRTTRRLEALVDT